MTTKAEHYIATLTAALRATLGDINDARAPSSEEIFDRTDGVFDAQRLRVLLTSTRNWSVRSFLLACRALEVSPDVVFATAVDRHVREHEHDGSWLDPVISLGMQAMLVVMFLRGTDSSWTNTELANVVGRNTSTIRGYADCLTKHGVLRSRIDKPTQPGSGTRTRTVYSLTAIGAARARALHATPSPQLRAELPSLTHAATNPISTEPAANPEEVPCHPPHPLPTGPSSGA
ncbi:hypothetical protein GCM10010174_03800 [Kutzneria viridogrisea]|uniref:DNA-binding MarR family transcriptional regulator n=1 Tax=Kutzneria viridogrisea TaxID=47990 RepID=A0ABR6BRE6_9PSEU|nr:DNA-binding MarR family transcriptional regulator [Kutzneria viridogrisea]